jgi:hypothetical protein
VCPRVNRNKNRGSLGVHMATELFFETQPAFMVKMSSTSTGEARMTSNEEDNPVGLYKLNKGHE